jgi:hypothetical protein
MQARLTTTVTRRIGHRRIARSRSVVVGRPTNFNITGRTTTPVIARITKTIPASVKRNVVA